MDYLLFKCLHLVSLVALFVSFGMILCTNRNSLLSRSVVAIHGVSWLLVLYTAHRLVAVLGLEANFPDWALAKTGIWILIGVCALLGRWKSQWRGPSAILGSLLGGAAVYLAVFKPF